MGAPKRKNTRQAPSVEQDVERGEFLRAIVDKARMLTGAQASALCVLDPASVRIRVVSASGSFADRIGAEASAQEGMSRHLLMSSHPALCASCESACCPFMPSSPHQHLIAPIRIDDRTRAVLCTTSATSATLPANHAPLMTHLARVAGSCLAEEPVWCLAEDLGAVAARRHAAADLHDGAAQKLVRLHMILDEALGRIPADGASLPELVTARELARSAIEDLRTLIAALRDPHDPSGRSVEVSEILREAARGAGMPGGVISVHAEHGCSVPHATAVQIRLVADEALANARRHANATAVSVRFSRMREEAIISVADNGRGFGSDARGAASHGTGSRATEPGRARFGMDIMRLRAATIGGRVEIRSAAGGGTEVLLRWPMQTT